MLTSTTFRITQDRPLNVIIVGGSISGLLTGLMLKRNGAHVTILEQTPHELEHQAAGIATGPPLAAFLAKFDRSARPFSLPTDGIHTVDRADRELGFTALDMRMNSWDALYYRLRWNFDGLASSYYPEEEEEEQQQQQQQQQPPLPLGEGARDGKAAYRSGCRLRGIQTGSGDSPVKVRFVHVRSGTETELAADLLIGADGANSAVRNMVLSPDERPKREYANYVLWRGVVPETAVSEKTRVLLEGKLSFLLLNRQYAIAYPIPGLSGSVSPGSRFLNFAWYAPLDVSELPSILTSTSGHLHRWSVPRGELRSDVWSVQTRRASSRLSPAFAELISAVDEPFVQVISDCRSARAVFAGGRILLVGDALSMIRPHTGKGVSFAASQVLGLEDWVKGKKDLAEWERNVVDGGWLGVLESRSWAAYYMGGSLEWAVSALKYRIAVKWVELKKWWRSRL